MKKIISIKILAIIFITMGITAISYSQIPTLPNESTFYDYLESFYSSSRYDPSESLEGGDLKEHERLSHIWGRRLHPHGDFSIANQALIDYAKNYQPVNTQSEHPNWRNIGPTQNPSNSNRNGVGQIHRITFDPNYGISNQTIYACTGYGGLWKTTDDGLNWENLNTDELPVTSVADIAVDPNNPQNLFIGTGLPDGGVSLAYSPNWANTNPIYTIGMYRSEDGGQT